MEEQQVKMAMEDLKSAEVGDHALNAQKIFLLANKAYLLYVSRDSIEKAKLLRMLFSHLFGGCRKCNARIQKALRHYLQKGSI
jgi:hypothetical protein